MAVQISFKPLYGILTDAAPLAFVLSIGAAGKKRFTALLDCGWADSFDPADLAGLADVASHVDVVLLSQPDLPHLGALPYAFAKLGLKAEVYATSPVHKMGTMFLYDAVTSRRATSEFDVFTLDDVDAALGRVHTLKYCERFHLSGNGKGIVITPHAAGHMLGGTVWNISTPEGEDVLYAVDYNHRTDRMLPESRLESLSSRPAVLITDTHAVDRETVEPAARDKALVDAVVRTLRRGGNVLIPTDTAGRMLDLLLLLHSSWDDNKLGLDVYQLVLLTHTAYNTLEFAKTSLQWMNDSIQQIFLKDTENKASRRRDNPFNMRCLKFCQSMEDFGHLGGGPKVVLASFGSLEMGLSRALAAEWAGDAKNLILLPGRPAAGTLAAELLEAKRGTALSVELSSRVPLEGDELRAFEEAQRGESAMDTDAAPSTPTAANPAALPATPATRASSGTVAKLRRDRSGRLKDGDEGARAKTADDAGPAAAPAGGEAPAVLIEGFEVPEGAVAPMFPDEDEQIKEEWTEYGIAVDPGTYAQHGTADAEMEEEPEVEEEPDIPTKVVTETRAVNLHASVRMIDAEGRTDRGSVCKIIESIAPRTLVLVHGTADATMKLSEMCSEALEGLLTSIHTPAIGTLVEISSPAPFPVVISDDVLQKVQLHTIGQLELGWLDATLGKAEAEGGPLQLLPNTDDQLTQGGVFLGDVRLSQLKKALAVAGIASSFQAGVLVCQGGVAVRTAGPEGSLLLEGPLGDNYYRVRDVVYAQYHIC